jgi:hypothetical protein
LSTKYVDILKLLGGSALVVGAAMIMLPDLVRLLTSLGRMALLIVVIVAAAFLITQVAHYIRKARSSATQQDPPEAKENVDQ